MNPLFPIGTKVRPIPQPDSESVERGYAGPMADLRARHWHEEGEIFGNLALGPEYERIYTVQFSGNAETGIANYDEDELEAVLDVLIAETEALP